MEQKRRALHLAYELFESLHSQWAVIECEAIARKLLSEARGLCQGDEGTVQADLLAALILSLESDLRRGERSLAGTLKFRQNKER